MEPLIKKILNSNQKYTDFSQNNTNISRSHYIVW